MTGRRRSALCFSVCEMAIAARAPAHSGRGALPPGRCRRHPYGSLMCAVPHHVTPSRRAERGSAVWGQLQVAASFGGLWGRGGGRGSDSEVLWGSVVLLSWFCCDLATCFFASREDRCRHAQQIRHPVGSRPSRGIPAGCWNIFGSLLLPVLISAAEPHGQCRRWHLEAGGPLGPASPQGAAAAAATEHPPARWQVLSPTGKT